MTDREKDLLAMAVEKCAEFPQWRSLNFIPRFAPMDATWAIETWCPALAQSAGHWETFSGDTLTEALSALLDSIGAEVTP